MVAILPGRLYRLINFRSSTAIEVPSSECASVTCDASSTCTPAVCAHVSCNTPACSPQTSTTVVTPASSTTTYTPATTTTTYTPATATTTHIPTACSLPAATTITSCTPSVCTCTTTTTTPTCSHATLAGNTVHVDEHHGHHLCHHKNHSQEWVFEERHGGVAILSKQTNKYLVVDGDLHHGARVVAVHTHTPQVWEIRRVENDCIRIFAVGTSYNIDLCEHWHGGHHALGHPGGVPLIISNNCPCKNQVWRAYSCGNVATVGLHAKL